MGTYSTVLDVVRATGLQVDNVIKENVGIGDSSTTVFDLDNQRVVENSEIIYIDGVAKTRTTDYTMNNNWGRITFGIAPTQDKAIHADYKYYPEGVTNEDVESYISDAEAEVEEYTGRKFVSGTSYIEYFEGNPEQIKVTDSVKVGSYYEISDEKQRFIVLSKYPVQSITSLQFLNDDGTVSDTLTQNTDFHLLNNRIYLFTNVRPVGEYKTKIKVVYTYGYTSVPRNIQNLVSVIAGIQFIVRMMGGSYDDMTSYSVPELTATLGEPYVNLRSALEQLEKKRDRLIMTVGRKVRSVVF